MENKKKSNKIFASLFLCIILTSLVAAFSISKPVELTEVNDLSLSLGETKEIFYYAQLASGEGDSVMIMIEQGSEVISLIGPSTVAVPANTIQRITFNLIVPTNANVGDSYPVSIVFRPTNQGTGTISVGTSIKGDFVVNIREKPKDIEKSVGPESSSINFILAVIVIIILIILSLVIFYFLKRKK